MRANTRKELASILKLWRSEQYKYIARDDNSPYIKAFGVKPIKAKTKKPEWVYENANAPGTIAIRAVHCEIATELRFDNPRPTLIEEWLKVYDR